jgi:hypothetical protein
LHGTIFFFNLTERNGWTGNDGPRQAPITRASRAADAVLRSESLPPKIVNNRAVKTADDWGLKRQRAFDDGWKWPRMMPRARQYCFGLGHKPANNLAYRQDFIDASGGLPRRESTLTATSLARAWRRREWSTRPGYKDDRDRALALDTNGHPGT